MNDGTARTAHLHFGVDAAHALRAAQQQTARTAREARDGAGQHLGETLGQRVADKAVWVSGCVCVFVSLRGCKREGEREKSLKMNEYVGKKKHT